MIHVLILFTASTVAIVAVRHLIRTRVKPVDQWSLDVQIPESFGQYDKELLASTSKEHLRESDYQAILEYLLMGIDAYREFKSFYVGEGWFTDGMGGAIDYYNVWQMQYMLFWLDRIAPSTDPDFLNGVFSEFASNYQYFIGTDGIPIFGRSCCYRLAAATPLIIMAHRSPASWSPIARRALETTWLYFIKHGALRSGGISQGYHGDDEDLLENHSSITAAFSSRNAGDPAWPNLPPFRRMSALCRQLKRLLKRPPRNENDEAKYQKAEYHSARPFLEQSMDSTTSGNHRCAP